MRAAHFLIFAIFLFPEFTLGAPPAVSLPVIPKDANCVLTISTVMKSGDTISEPKIFHFEKKADCEAAAATLRENFSPKEVVKKSVDIYWVSAP